MAQKILLLNSRDELYRIDIAQLVFFEAEGNYTSFTLCNKLRGVVGLNLSQMQQVLSTTLRENASLFARVGKRFIVNLNFVYHITPLRQELTLSDGRSFAYKLTISREALKRLKDLYIAATAGEHRQASE